VKSRPSVLYGANLFSLMSNSAVKTLLRLLFLQSIAEKLRAEHDQRQRTMSAGISRHNSTSSVQSVTSIEVAEITATARNAEAQIAELASQSTDDGLPLQQSNHHDDDVSTPDGNIRPVQPPFFTIPHGLHALLTSLVAIYWPAYT